MTGEISQLGRGLRTGLDRDATYHSIVPPIYPGTNFSFPAPGQPGAYEYTRSGNPTRDLLAEAITTLEGGSGSVVTASGLGALTTMFTALVPTRGRIVAPHDCYGGTWRLLNHLAEWAGLQVDYVDQTDAEALAMALTEPTDLLLVETPSNPLLRVVDLAATSAAAHDAGALVAVDNTFCSPIRQRPLEYGADLVVHSTTKFINGHSDVVGGAVTAATAEHAEAVVSWANVLGTTGSPVDSWLALRGLRTLEARVRVHDENSAAVVQLLVDHPAVGAVHYPGLADHPGHQIAARQQHGFGSMVSFELVGGEPAVAAFCTGLRLFCLAESLGGIESLVAHPTSMTHAAMTPEALAAAEITPSMLRLSVGIEPAVDVLGDLRDALDRAAAIA